ncbi:serine/threonine-protein phosphatase PP1(5.9) [Artemisia annua]|uniref:Serine/threonine-protein phosphatase PP1(5.9) n=1 Tax=Artemisia annua TaxID=35608 RepID=A0A2U1LT88_ARTAN|nr:serine/threonine-protein phosphatase PP1(5.9) [Artemisia annua]
MNIAFGTSENTKVVIDHGAVPIFVKLLASLSDNVREQLSQKEFAAVYGCILLRTRLQVFSGVVEPINHPNVKKKPAAYKLPHAKAATAKETKLKKITHGNLTK